MQQALKRQSVFNILLLRIFLVVIVINLLLTVINIRENLINQKKVEQYRLEKIQNEVKDEFSFLERNLSYVDKIFYNEAALLSQKLVDLNNSIDLKYVNLEEILTRYGFDSIYYDYYIIENGIIINTTFKKDLGLNLYSFGDAFTKYLKKILSDGVFVAEKSALEYGTKRFKNYSYRPTKDKKYIFEIGAYSEIVDGIMDAFTTRINNIVQENSDVKSINLWIQWNDSTFFPLLNLETFHEKNSLLLKVTETKDNISSKFIFEDRSYKADYLPQKAPNVFGIEHIIISIVTDITDIKIPIYKIVLKQIIYLLIFLLIIFLVLYLITKKFKDTLGDLLLKTTSIADGNLNERVLIKGNNEFTNLAEHFNYMIESIETKNKILFNQKNEIEVKNQEITSSILYAKYIQSSILPHKEILDKLLKNYFILFKPRDIVSGDFYWVSQIEGNTIIAAVDCTGHGVPGAFMSMLGAAFLNQIVTKEYITHPGVVLRKLRKEIIKSMQQRGERGEQKDGMDIALCTIDYKEMKLQFAGANNPLYLIRKSNEYPLNFNSPLSNNDYVFYEIKGDKMPISIYDTMDNFNRHEIDLVNGDMIYIFSDGFADQFGGPSGKKYMYKNLRQLLLDNCSKSMPDQKLFLEKTLTDWQGNYNQIDDILVIGIKIDEPGK